MAMTWIVGYILAGALIWGGLVKRKRPQRAATRQLSLVVGLLILLLMIAITLDDLFHWWSKFPKELVGIVGLLLVIERTIRFVRARRLSGALVLDLGRVPLQDMILNVFAGLALALLAVVDLIDITRIPNWGFRNISLQVLGLSISYAVLLQGLNRRGLNERGVFFGTGFLPWEKVKSFHWERESATASMLVLHKRTSMPPFNIMTLSVKTESASSIEEVLRQHAIAPENETPTVVGKNAS